MTTQNATPPAVLRRFQDAQNARDIDAFVACFDDAYRSAQPANPGREFTGSEQVRRNWSAIFDGVPDFRSDLVRWAEQRDELWAEWRWHGTRKDGTALDMRGVTIFGAGGDVVADGTLYMTDVAAAPESIDASVSELVHAAPDGPVAKVRQIYASFGAGDLDGVLAAMSPGVVVTVPGPADLPYFGVHTGRDGFGALLELLGREFDFSEYVPTDFIGAGDQVVVLLKIAATIRSTGRSYSTDLVEIWDFGPDGLVSAMRLVQDNNAVAAAMRH